MGNYSVWFQGLATCVGVLGLTILYGVLVAIGLSVAELLVRVARPGMNDHGAKAGELPRSSLSVEEAPHSRGRPRAGTGCPAKASRPPDAASGCTSCLPGQVCTCSWTVTQTCPAPCRSAR